MGTKLGYTNVGLGINVVKAVSTNVIAFVNDEDGLLELIGISFCNDDPERPAPRLGKLIR